MKHHGGLFPCIETFDNLLNAAKHAQCSKRYRSDVLEFNYNLERNLLDLAEALKTKTYSPGQCKTFVTYESKRRYRYCLRADVEKYFPSQKTSFVLSTCAQHDRHLVLKILGCRTCFMWFMMTRGLTDDTRFDTRTF